MRIIALVACLLAAAGVHAATRTWSGAAGNGQLMDPANWQGGVAPTSSDRVAFPEVAPVMVVTMPGDATFEGIDLTAHLDQLEKTYVLEALGRTDGNQTNAANLLRMSVRSLRHLLDKHGIRSLTAQMREDRRVVEAVPRRRFNDPEPRRRAYDLPSNSMSKIQDGE